jgi:hypothetical protein
MAKATEQASRRQDVPVTTQLDETPVKGAHYVQPHREDVAPAVRQTAQLIGEWRKSAR